MHDIVLGRYFDEKNWHLNPWKRIRFELSINTDVSVLRFYKYIKNIGGCFEKNIDEAKIIQNSWECLKNLQKIIK